MAITDTQARVKGRVWQAIAQSGVDVSCIPQEQMDSLVNTVSAAVLIELDELLTEASGRATSVTSPAATSSDGEQVLWEGRPFLSLTVHYQITTERIRIVRGMLGKDREDIELVRVQDVDQSQSLSERMLGIGDIHIRSHDPSSPTITLENVADPQEVHEILRQAVLEARKRHGLRYREEM